MPNCLITGLTGFVASHLLDYLLVNTDWEIYGLIRKRSPLDNIEHHFDLVNRGERVHLIYGDLTDLASVHRVMNEVHPVYIFHLAAQSDPKYSERAVAATLEANAIGTAHLLSCCTVAPRILICSSSEVYGKVKAENTPITEDCPFHPASPYAISKIATDLLAQYYLEAKGLDICITRMFTHTGPRRGDYFAESSFAKQIAMIEAGQLPPVVKHGNLDSLRTIADVRDTVRAYYMLITSRHKGVFNIGGTKTVRVRQILSDLMLAAGVRYAWEQDPERMRPVDADLQLPDCSKFEKATGWKPEITYEQTLQDLLDYWRWRVTKHKHLSR